MMIPNVVYGWIQVNGGIADLRLAKHSTLASSPEDAELFVPLHEASAKQLYQVKRGRADASNASPAVFSQTGNSTLAGIGSFLPRKLLFAVRFMGQSVLETEGC
ncbi:unnamed protein product [Somion occarium]|uniref:Uncharacterized protein n=1 Tax=Somion occarium TaxID=3059160 RepID=A0ABP1DLR5_9APHY